MVIVKVKVIIFYFKVKLQITAVHMRTFKHLRPIQLRNIILKR